MKPATPTLKDLFREMLRLRMVEEEIARLYPEQEMRCPTHLYIGQEAVAAGIGAALAAQDALFGTYRSHGLYLSKGGDMKAMIAELYGKKTGTCKGKSGSMQMVAPEVGLLCTSAIVGGTIPMAVGAGLAFALEKSGRVACGVFGDGATEEGVFHESVNFATLKKLPVIFACENNLYSVYTHISKRRKEDHLCKLAGPYGMPAECCDGNDVAEVYGAIKRARKRALDGKGPTFLEFRTYRWLEHVGPNSDEHLGYRTPKEVAQWKKRCPVKTLEAKLLKNKTLTRPEIEQARAEIAQEIKEAVEFAKKSSFPGEADLTYKVYA